MFPYGKPACWFEARTSLCSGLRPGLRPPFLRSRRRIKTSAFNRSATSPDCDSAKIVCYGLVCELEFVTAAKDSRSVLAGPALTTGTCRSLCGPPMLNPMVVLR